MDNFNIVDFKDEVKYQLLFPADKCLPRWVMMQMLQLSEHEYRKLMKMEVFTWFEHLGIIWFYTREIYHWAYKFKPEVAQFIIPFPPDKHRLRIA